MRNKLLRREVRGVLVYADIPALCRGHHRSSEDRGDGRQGVRGVRPDCVRGKMNGNHAFVDKGEGSGQS